MDTGTRIKILADEGLPDIVIAAILGVDTEAVVAHAIDPSQVPAVGGGGGGGGAASAFFDGPLEIVTAAGDAGQIARMVSPPVYLKLGTIAVGEPRAQFGVTAMAPSVSMDTQDGNGPSSGADLTNNHGLQIYAGVALVPEGVDPATVEVYTAQFVTGLPVAAAVLNQTILLEDGNIYSGVVYAPFSPNAQSMVAPTGDPLTRNAVASVDVYLWAASNPPDVDGMVFGLPEGIEVHVY